MINQQRLLDTFLEIVQVDSESKNERQIVDHMMKMLKGMGYEAIEDDAYSRVDVGAGNIIVTIPGTVKAAKKLLFTSHVDTVFPGKGIVPVIRDGYIYSQGNTVLGSDDKAGVAAILELLHVLKEQSIEHGGIQIVFTVGEESGLLGAKFIDQSLLDADMGIALDGLGDVGTIVVQGPMQVSLKATITGKAAHAGVCPEAGISAIEVAAAAITNMKLGRIDEETTANIGIIKGGLATNIVCETVEIDGEARSLDRNKLQLQVEDMRQALQQSADSRGAKVEITINEEYPEFHFDIQEDEIQIVTQAMQKIGAKPDYVKSGGGSDASVFNGYGIKTINLGIGMEEVHSVNERIAVEQLNKAAEVLVALVETVKEF